MSTAGTLVLRCDGLFHGRKQRCERLAFNALTRAGVATAAQELLLLLCSG